MYRIKFVSNLKEPETFDTFIKEEDNYEKALDIYKDLFIMTKTILVEILTEIKNHLDEKTTQVFEEIIEVVKELEFNESVELSANDGPFLVTDENYLHYELLGRIIELTLEET